MAQMNVKLTYISKLHDARDLYIINDIHSMFSGLRYVMSSIGKLDWRQFEVKGKSVKTCITTKANDSLRRLTVHPT